MFIAGHICYANKKLNSCQKYFGRNAIIESAQSHNFIIQDGSDNADKVHDMVDCHEYRLEMMAAFQPSFMVEK